MHPVLVEIAPTGSHVKQSTSRAFARGCPLGTAAMVIPLVSAAPLRKTPQKRAQLNFVRLLSPGGPNFARRDAGVLASLPPYRPCAFVFFWWAVAGRLVGCACATSHVPSPTTNSAIGCCRGASASCEMRVVRRRGTKPRANNTNVGISNPQRPGHLAPRVR